MKMKYLLLAVPLVAMATFVAAQAPQKDNSQNTKATGGVWNITVGPNADPMTFVPDSLPMLKLAIKFYSILILDLTLQRRIVVLIPKMALILEPVLRAKFLLSL